MQNFIVNPETLVTSIPVNEETNRRALKKFKKEAQFMNCLSRCLEKTKEPIYQNPSKVNYELSDEDASHLHVIIKNNSMSADPYLPPDFRDFVNRLNEQRKLRQYIRTSLETKIDLNYITWNDRNCDWGTGLFIKVEGFLNAEIFFPSGSLDYDRLRVQVPFCAVVEHPDWVECNCSFTNETFHDLVKAIDEEIKSEIRHNLNRVESALKAFQEF